MDLFYQNQRIHWWASDVMRVFLANFHFWGENRSFKMAFSCMDFIPFYTHITAADIMSLRLILLRISALSFHVFPFKASVPKQLLPAEE